MLSMSFKSALCRCAVEPAQAFGERSAWKPSAEVSRHRDLLSAQRGFSTCRVTPALQKSRQTGRRRNPENPRGQWGTRKDLPRLVFQALRPLKATLRWSIFNKCICNEFSDVARSASPQLRSSTDAMMCSSATSFCPVSNLQITTLGTPRVRPTTPRALPRPRTLARWWLPRDEGE